MKTSPPAEHKTLVSYIAGFVSSVVLTITAYILVVQDSFSKEVLVGTILGLAILQLFAQLYFFLHLGRETKPRWKLTIFAFMTMVLMIVVLGSLWIMYSLDYRMEMPPHELDTQIIEDEGYQR